MNTYPGADTTEDRVTDLPAVDPNIEMRVTRQAVRIVCSALLAAAVVAFLLGFWAFCLAAVGAAVTVLTTALSCRSFRCKRDE